MVDFTTGVAVEPQPLLQEPATGTALDDGSQGRLPVFVSVDGRRGRVLRVVGRAAGGLTVLWVAALLAGALGLGRLPGMPFPDLGGISASGGEGTPPRAQGRGAANSPNTPGRGSGGQAAAQGRHPSESEGGAGLRGLGTGERSAGRGAPGPVGRRLAVGPPQRGAPRAGVIPGSRAPTRAVTGPPARTAPPGRSRSTIRLSRDKTGAGTTHGTSNPGVERASPSSSALDHSRRWLAGGG
jgi:hypothetical protein